MTQVPGLYELQPAAADVSSADSGLMLLHGMQGFADAGHAVKLVTSHLQSAMSPRLVATFDVDQLHDYRARRPMLTFRDNTFSGLRGPELNVWSLHNDADQPVALLLSGMEPDVRWNSFADAVGQLVDVLGVTEVIGLSAIPMAVPHTRPLGLTAHSANRDLIREHPMWPGELQIPASAGTMLEYKLGQAGIDALGYSAHVPHYLAQMEYPEAALLLIESVSEHTGVQFPLDDLRAAAARVRESVVSNVTGNAEVEQVVEGLERQYDAMIASQEQQTALLGGRDIPTGDEIGAEFERFLAQNDDDATRDDSE